MKTFVRDALFDVGRLETSKLKEIFGFSPFSIFDTTSGDWIRRRNEWKRLGIESGMGRCDNLLRFSKLVRLKADDETIAIFAECRVSASKYKNGWLLVGNINGQAERNTRWQKTFKMWLEEQGFETSMYYQID